MSIIMRLPDSMGCTVASTAVIKSVIEQYKNEDIKVITPFPDLLIGFKCIEIINSNECGIDIFDVDLREYTKRRPHNSLPFRSSYIHMIEMAENQINDQLKRMTPEIILNEHEEEWAKKEIKKYPFPLIWIQSISTSSNRLWPEENWKELKNTFLGIYSFIDLSTAGYSLRESLAIAKYSFSGVCLDSFMVHGSAAVNANNVLVILGSSRPECVTYPGQHVFYKNTECNLQPCAMHGYFNGCKKEHESLFYQKNCIYPQHKCMNSISTKDVIETIKSFGKHKRLNMVRKQYDYNL